MIVHLSHKRCTRLLRWRAGNTENVRLKLPVVRTYALTVPYVCAKSKRISVAQRQSNFLSFKYRAPVGAAGVWQIPEHKHD